MRIENNFAAQFQLYTSLKIHSGLPGRSAIPNPSVTIGTFDGVHTGHRKILDRLNHSAREISGESVVVTFYPHPRMILHPADHGLKLLNTPEEKIELLDQAGIDHLVIVPFSREFSRQAPDEYVRELLVNGLAAKNLIIGYDHRFGRNREGDIGTLKTLSELFGFEVEEIPAQTMDAVEVSSTKIRNALMEGDLHAAKRFLGYHYSLTGIVEKGEGRGRTIGIPTANIRLNYDYKLVPLRGVYAVQVTVKNGQYRGVMNIGVRPTIGDNLAETLEVHILEFDAPLYGETITAELVCRIRDEKKFGSIDELRTQISHDMQIAQKFFDAEAY